MLTYTADGVDKSLPMKRLRSDDVANLLVDLQQPDTLSTGSMSPKPIKHAKRSKSNDSDNTSVYTEHAVKEETDTAVLSRVTSYSSTTDLSKLTEQLQTERTRADQIEERYYDLLHRLKLVCSHINVNDTKSINNTVLKHIQSLQTVLSTEMIQCETIEQLRKQQLHTQMSVNKAQQQQNNDILDDTELGNNKRTGSYGYYCRPSRFIGHLAKEPVAISWANVKRQYTVSKRETTLMSKTERDTLMPVPVRIMGIPTDRNNLYIVAKDVCQLIHIRKANVARSIGQFSDREKARMPVLCKRSNKIDSTHVLIVLTLDGVKRLLTSSRSPLAPIVLQWLNKEIDQLIESAHNGTLNTSQHANLHQYDDYGDDDIENDNTPLQLQLHRQRSASPPADLPSHRMSKQQTKNKRSSLKRVKSDTKVNQQIHDLPLLEPESISTTPSAASPTEHLSSHHSDIDAHTVTPATIVSTNHPQQYTPQHTTLAQLHGKPHMMPTQPLYALPVARPYPTYPYHTDMQQYSGLNNYLAQQYHMLHQQPQPSSRTIPTQ